MNINKKLIWQAKQNKPSYIVKDLTNLLHHWRIPNLSWIIYFILLQRGVFKWLAVRRRLIKLKIAWRDKTSETIEEIKQVKKERNSTRLLWLRGYLRALEECRKEVRDLCHSSRWQAPDNDKKAQEFLRQLEERNEIYF